MKFGIVFSSWIVFLALIVAGNAMAQSTTRGVSVTGTVLDPSGASTPDATVTLMQGKRRVGPAVKTDLTGKFRFDSVPRGTYSVEVQHEGFQDSATPLVVSTKPPAELTIALALAGVATEVSVDESESTQVSTDIASNSDAAAVDQNMLEKVPVFDQDYVAAMSTFLDAAAMGTGGTQLIVDGMAVNNVGVSASAIQEVRINQNPYSAEFARPGRGSIEIITKGTTTQYHGTFNFIFRDYHLNARDPFALVRAPEQRRIYEGAFSGPVGHSKTTSFLFSGTRQEEDLQSFVFANGPSGIIQQNVASPKRNTQVSFRLMHQFTPDHSMTWQYNDREFPSKNQGVGGFVLPEAGKNQNPWEREVVVTDRWSLTPQWISQYQILIGREQSSTTSISSAPMIVVNGAFTSGGAQSNLLNTENHVQMNEIISWSAGKHLVKFGFNMPDFSRRGVDNYNNFGGTFYFASLQDYLVQNSYAFRQQQGSGHVVYWQKELGGFVQDDFRVLPNLSLSLGLRYNWQNYLHSYRDFAPRLAFAYSPAKSRKTVLRGGAGVFYDRTNAGPIADLLLYNGQVLRNILITDPSYPNPFFDTGSLNALPTDVVRLDPTVREPYSIQYSFAVERQLAKRTTLAFTYSGSRGIGLFRSRDINAPLGPDYLVRPNPALGVDRQIESSGRQTGNTLDITLRGDMTHYLSGLIQYTLSKTYNNTGGISWFPANQYDLSGEWSLADFDQRHRLNLLESFDARKYFNLGVALTLSSGKPYTLITGDDPFHTGLANARPQGVARNSLTGPGFADLDLRLSRDFNWSKVKKDKGWVTSVSLDAFNVLNHVNYTSFVGDQSSHFFGHAVSALPTRRLQFTLRFKF